MDMLVRRPHAMTGQITPPPSKSYTHRVLAAASLSDHTIIKNPSHSDANEAMKNVCGQLGADITPAPNGDYDVRGFGSKKPDERVWVGNSGTALRLSIGLGCIVEGKKVIDGDASLQKRPTGSLVDALHNLGCNVSGTKIDGEEYAPITINGGQMPGGHTEILGTKSSQYLSSLLLACPRARSDVDITVTGDFVSEPYIKMTLSVAKRFGIKVDHTLRHFHIESGQDYVSPGTFEIPPDYSQAAFFLAAACLVDSDVTLKGLLLDDLQADRQIIDILEDMGAKIQKHGDDLRVCGPFDLEGIEVDLINAPDLFPVLSVLGIYAKGSMRLYNMPQIRYKETDRIAVIAREFKKYGISTDEAHDEMTIHHKDMPDQNYDFSAKGGHGVTDHRISMALSLVGISSGRCTIRDADMIGISYPDYFAHLKKVGIQSSAV